MSSGKFVLRMEARQHRKLQVEARRRGLSLNTLCLEKIESSESKTPLQLTNLILQVYKNHDPQAILLYGSQARNKASKSSDTDVMIVFAETFSPTRQDYRIWDEKIAPLTSQDINPSLVSFQPQRLPTGLWLELALDGQLLWMKDSTLKVYLSSLRSKIAAGEFKRRFIHGQPHWTQNEKKQSGVTIK